MESDWTAYPYVPRDLGWAALTAFCMSRQELPSLKTPAFGRVATVIKANIERIKSMVTMHMYIGNFATMMQRYIDLAELSATGTLINSNEDHERIEDFFNTAAARMRAEAERRIPLTSSISPKEHEAELTALINRSYNVVENIMRSPLGAGLEAILSSTITGTWTSFATMASDLWEAALNAHPDLLSELKGDRKRILRSDEKNDSILDIEKGSTVPAHLLTRHRYDKLASLGSALRGLQSFDSLTGIRMAYGVAFHKRSDAVDEALKDESFDTLSALRNVIVQRASIADQCYKTRSEHLPNLPKAAVGNVVRLEGGKVGALMMLTMHHSHKLLIAVYDWVVNN
jgi:hypothetical protein